MTSLQELQAIRARAIALNNVRTCLSDREQSDQNRNSKPWLLLGDNRIETRKNAGEFEKFVGKLRKTTIQRV